MRRDASDHTDRRPVAARRVVLSDVERRRRLLDAAATVFLANGFASTTMDSVAVAAGMSKKTLYQLHPSKLALFEALVVDRIFGIEIGPIDPALPQEERLTCLLLSLGRSLLDPERIGLIRLLMVENQGGGALSRCFRRVKADYDMTALERWLAAEQEAGLLQPGPIPDAARHLFGLTIGESILAVLIDAPPPDAGLEGFVRRGVRIYLRGLDAVGPGNADVGAGGEAA